MNHQKSLLLWTFEALGFRYSILLPTVAALSFALTLLVILRSRNSAGWIALLFIVPMPVIVGVLGALDGLIASLTVISTSDSPIRGSELAMGMSMSLVAPLAGMLLTAPSFMLAMVGLIVRSFQKDPTSHVEKG